MSSHDRRAAARRRAWGRGPIILRFDSLESRHLLTAKPDLVASSFTAPTNLDWGDSFHAVGSITNQGSAPVTQPFQVEIFASSKRLVGPRSVPLGEVTIPAGLAPGASAPFDQEVSLPPTPISGLSSQQPQHVYVGLWVDPAVSVPEGNTRNNLDLGRGFDTSVVTITQHQPANLVGTSLGVSPDLATWGGQVTVTVQVSNEAQGDAPATRARVVLTPGGLAPGGPSDVTVGNLAIPPIPAWQTANVVQQVTLPAVPPASLAGSSQFVLSVVQDADFLTNPLSPHVANQGTGKDMVAVNIGPGPASNATPPALPDLAATTVVTPSQLSWGHDFQVVTQVQNLGQADAGPFRVRFLLVGAGGSTSSALFLGDVMVDGLQAGASQQLSPNLRLPAEVPDGLTLSSQAVGRIAMVIDPETALEESFKTNNTAESAPVVLRLLGADGTSTVPTSPPVGVQSVLQQQQPTPEVPATPGLRQQLRLALTGRAPLPDHSRGVVVGPNGRIVRRQPPPNNNTFEHQLKVFPQKIGNFFSDLWTSVKKI